MGNNIGVEKEKPEVAVFNASRADEEPFDFAQIPADLQYKIVEKWSYKRFSLFDQTCRLGNAVCWAKTYSCPYGAGEIYIYKKSMKILPDIWNEKLANSENWVINTPLVPWHVAARSPTQMNVISVVIKGRVSSGRMQAAARLLEKNKTNSSCLKIVEPITFKPEDLNRLIKAIKTEALICRPFLAQEFFQVEAVQNLENIYCDACGFTDDELLQLKCHQLFVTNDFVTGKGLNSFLKQWKRKERWIDEVQIDFDISFGTRDFDEILDGVGANVVWTPEFHEHSIVAKIKREEFRLMNNGNPLHIYSVWRTDDMECRRFICLAMHQFEVFHDWWEWEAESSYLLDQLTDDQYYIVLEKCRFCYEEFCKHRRRYSTQRMKKYFPQLYSFMMNNFKGALYIFGALRIENVLLGERYFNQLSSELEPTPRDSFISRLFSILRGLFFDLM